MTNNTKSKDSGKHGRDETKAASGFGKRKSGKSSKGSSGTTRADYEVKPRSNK